MVLSNYRCMHIRIHIRIQNSRILIQTIPSLTSLFQYSTVHSNRIESTSINSTIRNRLLLQLFISENSKQWDYSLHRDFQKLHSTQRSPRDSSNPETAFYTKKSKGFFKFYILHSTFRYPYKTPSRTPYSMQKTESSSIQFYIQKAKRSLSTSIHPTRPSKGIPDIPDIPVIHDIQPSRHYYMFQYFQYLPVHPGFHPITAFSN